MNFGLAHVFPRRSRRTPPPTRVELYNARIAKLTGWGFAVIGVPILVFLFFTLRRLLKKLAALTGFKDEEMMLPR